jgi:hypothetical protein
MTEGLKDRPAMLRRTPRPAPDEKVDPVDYSPAAVAPVAPPVPAPVAEASAPAQASGGVGATGASPAPAPTPVQPAVTEEAVSAPAIAAAAPAPKAKPATRTPKASKAPTSRKSARREVTYPLSTRISEEVSDILYSTVEELDMTVREVIEQAIKARWGQN